MTLITPVSFHNPATENNRIIICTTCGIHAFCQFDKNGEKKGIHQIADYMFRADTIYRMKLAASDMGLPVLTLIARERQASGGVKVEVFFDKCGI